jgi:hypothetical protein
MTLKLNLEKWDAKVLMLPSRAGVSMAYLDFMTFYSVSRSEN